MKIDGIIAQIGSGPDGILVNGRWIDIDAASLENGWPSPGDRLYGRAECIYQFCPTPWGCSSTGVCACPSLGANTGP